LSWGDIHARVRGNLTAVIWNDRWTYTYTQMCINYQQKATFVRNMGKLRNLLVFEDTWTKLTKGTEWLIAIQLVIEHRSRQKKYLSLSWTSLY